MEANESVNDPIIPVSITLPKSLVASIDQRAQKADLNRSQYLRRLAREDIARDEGDKKETLAA